MESLAGVPRGVKHRRPANSRWLTLGADLVDDRRRVSGCARDGSADNFTAQHFMVADIGGRDVVHENTLLS